MPEIKKTVKNTAKNKGKLKPPWQPGQSGNPNGRPKKEITISDILRAGLDEKIDGKTRREHILNKVLWMAGAGDKWAIEFIADRTEGKALERVESKEIKDEIIIE